MALAPAPAPPPAAGAPPLPPDMGAAPMDMGMEAPVEEDPGEVVATILKKADGTWVLEGAGAPAADMGMGGLPPEPGMEGEAPMGPEPQTFDDIGDLLTAVHNLVDPENPEGPAAQANFEEGFKGEEEAPAEPIKAAM